MGKAHGLQAGSVPIYSSDAALHKLRQTPVTQKAITKMGRGVTERNQVDEGDSIHNKEWTSVPKPGHFSLDPLPNKSNFTSEPNVVHNCNGREEKMNQKFPWLPASSLSKRQIFKVENSLKYWNIKDHQWLSDTGFLSLLYEKKKGRIRTIKRK